MGVLHNLTIEVEGAEGYDPLSYMACEKLSFGTPGKSYTILSYPDEICASTLSCTMKFEVHDCDPNTGDEDEQGFPDEYVIDDIEITIGDFIQKVVRSNFSAAWEEIGDDHEVENTYHLSTLLQKLSDNKNHKYSYFKGLPPSSAYYYVQSYVLFLIYTFWGENDFWGKDRVLSF